MIDTIIFDLGKVLIDWEPKRLYRKIFRTEIAVEHFLNTVTTGAWNEQQDAGRPIRVANDLLISQFPEYTDEIRAYYARWEDEMLGGAFQGTVDILEKLIHNDAYRVYALTNWSDETFHHALAKFEFLSWFEGIVVSGKEKLKKPDPRIYELLLTRYDLAADRCIFIDDSLKNVKGAEAVGIKAIHFTSDQALKKSLESEGVTL